MDPSLVIDGVTMPYRGAVQGWVAEERPQRLIVGRPSVTDFGPPGCRIAAEGHVRQYQDLERGMSNVPPITTDGPEEAITEWFTLLDEYCEAEDYEAMRPHVAQDVVSFGTRAEIVVGRGRLIENQWRAIWGNIEDFSIDLDGLRAFGEGSTAWGVATWDSTGFDESGEPFHRPGRATVTLERRDGAWLARHTHFSLYPGTPQFTHGPDGRD